MHFALAYKEKETGGEQTVVTTEDWKDCVEKYQRLVFTVCFQMIGDYQEAQNLAQETFLSAYTHREGCRMETVKPWLTRIASNKAKDYLKSAYRNQRREELSEEMETKEGQPESLFFEKEGYDKVRDAILSLEEPYHMVCVGYFLQEKNLDEIAEQLKRPRKTVQTQIYRGRQQLKEKLQKGGAHGKF